MAETAELGSMPQPFAAPEFALVSYAVRLEVPQLVTIMAKSDAVRDVMGKFRIVGEPFQVMGSQIATAVISAVLARIPVAFKDSLSPYKVFWSPTKIDVALPLPVLPRVMSRTTSRVLLECRRNLRSDLFGARHSLFGAGLPFASRADLGTCFRRMYATLESAWASFRAHANFDASAWLADCRKAIVTRAVAVEGGRRAPLCALPTPLLSGRDARMEVFNRKSSFTGEDFHRPFVRLSHASNLSDNVVPALAGRAQ